MTQDTVTLSDKYQLVVPKEVRRKMGITKADGQRFTIVRATKNEVLYRKAPTLEDFYNTLEGAFASDANKQLRKMRGQDWR